MMPVTEMTKVLIVRSETGLGSITHVICVQDPNCLSYTSRVGVKLTNGYIGCRHITQIQFATQLSNWT